MSYYLAGSGVAGASASSGSSATNSSSFSSGRQIGVAPENDKVKRNAKVYLYTRPVEAFPAAESEAYHHWALVFHFEDDIWRTVEGFCDEKNQLTPSYSKEQPTEEGNYRLLGEVQVSPAELRDFAVSNEANGKPYLETLHNCQDWVCKIAKKFGRTLIEKIEKFDTLKKVNPLLAYVGGSVAASRNTLCSSFQK